MNAEAALTYYASKHTYKVLTVNGVKIAPIDLDRGRNARTALKTIRANLRKAQVQSLSAHEIAAFGAGNQLE